MNFTFYCILSLKNAMSGEVKWFSQTVLCHLSLTDLAWKTSPTKPIKPPAPQGQQGQGNAEPMWRNESPQVPERMREFLDFLKSKKWCPCRGAHRESRGEMPTEEGSPGVWPRRGCSKEVLNSLGTVGRKYMRTENPGLHSTWVWGSWVPLASYPKLKKWPENLSPGKS